MRRFLYYIDKNTTQGIKKWERVYKPNEYVEETVPSDAPDWTKSGYDSPLRKLAIKAVSKYTNWKVISKFFYIDITKYDFYAKNININFIIELLALFCSDFSEINFRTAETE